MSAVSVRVAVVPGRSVIGIELPNAKRETVFLRELLSTEAFEDGRLACRWRWARISAARRSSPTSRACRIF
jgi:DNA segregation ATPase FtsK/SpoIIIE-like protein